MTVDELPLLELFTRLREEAGLPLGINEYYSLLEALKAGFGIPDRASIARLCCALWVKSAEEKRLFDFYFNQIVGEYGDSVSSPRKSDTSSLDIQNFNLRWFNILKNNQKLIISGIFIFIIGAVFVLPQTRNWLITKVSEISARYTSSPQVLQPSPSQQPSPVESAKPIPKTDENAPPVENPDETSKTEDVFIILKEGNLVVLVTLFIFTLVIGFLLVRWIVRQLIKNFFDNRNLKSASVSKISNFASKAIIREIQDELQIVQSIRQTSGDSQQKYNNHLTLTNEYLPVTRRQMKQIWRYLRQPIREGAKTELDVEATINQIGKQGLMFEPVLMPNLVNKTQIIILIDRDGSMVTFHNLCFRLLETAQKANYFDKFEIYYFHNCPVQYLYSDPYRVDAISITDVLSDVNSQRLVVLIVSDAGAARSGFNQERINLTREFIFKLRHKVRRVALLNPMPSQRWDGTTAEEIAKLIPMFELNKKGLQNAIHFLRGYSKQF